MNINRFLFVVGLVLLATLRATAQDSTNWKRVYTGDGYVIDFNAASLDFGPGQTLLAQIRTVLEKEEVVRGGSGAKSKTRLEKVEYRLRQGDYRIVQVVLLDAAGKPVQTQNLDAPVWKPLKSGGMMERVLLASRAALPFGEWKVAAYRLVEGDERSKQAADELKRLIGLLVSLEAEVAKVDQSACRNPAYTSEHFTVAELSRRLGSEIKLPEIQSEQVDLIYIKCNGDGWEPPQSMLVKLPEGRLLMLWKGVFLTLKRT